MSNFLGDKIIDDQGNVKTIAGRTRRKIILYRLSR